MYLSGRGMPQNTAEGMRLLRLSAEQGDKNAQANLDAIERSGKALAP
jgi:TPR repeat protein